MKSRLAILGMLVAGLLFSGTGGALAISGFSGADGNAAKVQYKPHDNGAHNGGTVGGESTNNGPGGGNGGTTTPETGTATSSPLQPAQQVEAGASGGNSLPFTGFAAIPVLLGGIALLSAGLILRRRARES